jgi:hypothetical protein
MFVRSCAAVLALLAGCLAENPPEDETGGTSESVGTGTETETGGVVVPPGSMFGCPEGEVCTIVIASQSFDDRVEVFAPDDPVHAYRGAIDIDLRTGVDADNLDEPVGIALTDQFLHISAGHYPTPERGTLVSIPRTRLGNYDAGTTMPVGDILLAGAFQDGIVQTPLDAAEPIFVLPTPVEGRLLIGTFNNNLFNVETNWTMPGLLHVVDVADPTQFGTATLEGCDGAAQVVMMDGTNAAVACDGNEAVAFVSLGDIGTGTPDTAAQAIGNTSCEVYQQLGFRVRYLAFDGIDGVFVGYGPGLMEQQSAGRVYRVRRNCDIAQVELGMMGTAHPAQIVPVGDAFVVASGTPNDEGVRGLYVVTADLQLCPQPIAGFDDHWTINRDTGDPFTIPLQPFAVAVAPDGTHLAVGAAVNPVRAMTGSEEVVYGKVLWATLSNIENPCEMTATVVDLTDNAPGHAPSSTPGMPATYRQQTYAVAVAQVAG